MTTSLLAYIPSPSQGVWHLGFLPIRAYALCIITGIVAALVISDRRWVARGGQPGIVYDIALWAVPFGLVGGRLYHVMTDWPTYFGENGAGFLAALRIWDGGLGIWGAVALGGVGAWIGCRRSGIPLPAFADAVAPGIVLAQAIGRLGNYFNQELYGRVTTLPWGLEIFERRDANGALDTLNGVSTGEQIAVVHPTFLYELLWNLLIFAILIYVDRRFKIGHARLFALYVAGYCVGRFWIELMRSDHATEFGGIRVNTFTSTFVFIGAVVYIMVATKGREDPASLVGNDIDEDDKAAKRSLPEKAAAGAGAAGVAAAAVVADKSDGGSGEAEAPDEGDAVADSETEGLGSVDGAEVVAASEDAADANAAVVEKAADADELAAEVVESEPEAEPESDAIVEPEADTGSDAEPDDIGSVEGDEVAAAVADAPEANAAIAKDAADAEELAAEAAESEPDADAEADGETDADAEADGETDADAEADGETDADDIGSVTGDEVAAAVEDAPEANAAIAEEAVEADELAADVAEPAPGSEPEDEVEPESEAEAEAEPEAEPEPGADDIGSVAGDEVKAAVAGAPKIHKAAVKKSAEADNLEADVAEESAPDAVGEPAESSETESEETDEPKAT